MRSIDEQDVRSDANRVSDNAILSMVQRTKSIRRLIIQLMVQSIVQMIGTIDNYTACPYSNIVPIVCILILSSIGMIWKGSNFKNKTFEIVFQFETVNPRALSITRVMTKLPNSINYLIIMTIFLIEWWSEISLWTIWVPHKVPIVSNDHWSLFIIWSSYFILWTSRWWNQWANEHEASSYSIE